MNATGCRATGSGVAPPRVGIHHGASAGPPRKARGERGGGVNLASGRRNSTATRYSAGWAEIGTCGSAIAALMRCWNSVSAVAACIASGLSQWATLTSWNRDCDERARCSRESTNPGLVLISAARPHHSAMNASTCCAGTSKTLISVTGEPFAGWLFGFMEKSPESIEDCVDRRVTQRKSASWQVAQSAVLPDHLGSAGRRRGRHPGEPLTGEVCAFGVGERGHPSSPMMPRHLPLP
jgi:hypothetical protein